MENSASPHIHTFGEWSKWRRYDVGRPTDANHFRTRECTGFNTTCDGREFEDEAHCPTIIYANLDKDTRTSTSTCKCGREIKKSGRCVKVAYGEKCNVPGCKN